MNQTEETGNNQTQVHEYKLTGEEKQELLKCLPAYLLMGGGDISGLHWEDMFSLTKSIPRVKGGIQLYDVIDTEKRIGWSAKTVTTGKSIKRGSKVTANIQHHSSIYSSNLGLTRESNPQLIGNSLLDRWNIEKVLADKAEKGLLETRMCMLVKSKNKNQFAYYEADIEMYSHDEISWEWSTLRDNGVLVGTRIFDGFEKYRWTSNCGTLRENIFLPNDLEIFDITPISIPIRNLIDSILAIQEEFRIATESESEVVESEEPAKINFKQSLFFWYKNTVGRISSFMNMVTAKVVAT